MYTNLIIDQNWHIPNQQTVRYEQICNPGINVTVKLIRQTTFEQAQHSTLYFQQAQSLQNPAYEYGHPVVQSTHLMNHSPYMNQFQNTANQDGHLSTSKTDPSSIELFNQEQALQRDTNTLTSKLTELQTQYKNYHF